MSLVEYYDPDGLFPLLLPQLRTHLPLRNLHWKSPNRPLRSIATLPVDFVPSEKSRDTVDLKRTSQGENLDTTTSQEVSREYGEQDARNSSGLRGESLDGKSSDGKSRRHQIPGLRQTPFLKLYLLRCDDNEAYKSSSRKLLREWIRDNTPPSQSSGISSKQENHDAFEWLIVHVVLPDTAASAQPRALKHSSTESEGVKEKGTGGARWPGRSSGTILEKIRADFNQTGKTAPDRVAQIRLSRDAVPMHLVFAKPASGSVTPVESAQDKDFAWNDMVSKFKALILSSFNLRVSQYEDDIREKAAQSALPGWNFCTFFILKEGLARAFESVGLYEDALVGYDELAVGLDTAIREISSASSTGPANTFHAYTEDLQTQVKSLASALSQDEAQDTNSAGFSKPINTSIKDYRRMIMSNEISIYDFHCYLFARQMALLLRLANIRQSSDESNENRTGPTFADILEENSKPRNAVDPAALGELCSRCIEFTTSTMRIMRADLIKGSENKDPDNKLDAVRDAMLVSWGFEVVQQLLDETASYSSSGSVEGLNGDKRSQTQPNYPSRRSSLPVSSQPKAMTDKTPTEKFDEVPLKDIAPAKNAAFASVAAHRAELYQLQRKLLETTGVKCGIRTTIISSSQNNLTNGHSTDNENLESHARYLRMISSPALRTAVSSSENYIKRYETLSNQIARNYYVADRKKSAESIITDMAILKFRDGDYAAASGYFARLAPSFAELKWNAVEVSILKMYATTLKELHRKDEHVRVVLNILAKSSETKRSRLRQHRNNVQRKTESSADTWTKTVDAEVSELATALISYSKGLPYDISVPMGKYFESIQFDSFTEVFSDRDGFRLCLKLRQLIANTLPISSLRVRLVNTADVQSRELWLESEEPFEMGLSIESVYLTSNTTTRGQFIVDKILVKAGKILFTQEALMKTEATPPDGLTGSVAAESIQAVKSSPILCYPRQDSLLAKATKAETVHIGRSRAIDIQLDTGSNDVQHGQIILRAASAGLRLRTTEAELIGVELPLSGKSKPGVIEFKALNADTSYKIRIPYDVERNVPAISLRIEVHYHTGTGDFLYLDNFNINVEVPLDVNVHDIFKSNSLISKIWIQPTGHSPMYLLQVKLEGSGDYRVQSPAPLRGLLTFPQQPACATYSISSAKSGIFSGRGTDSGKLVFTIDYRSLQEDIVDQASESFRQCIKELKMPSASYYLEEAFRNRLRSVLSRMDLEAIGISGELEDVSFDDFNWEEVLQAFPGEHQATIKSRLEMWHKENLPMELRNPEEETYLASYPAQKLKIDFEVPRVSYVHTTSLRFNGVGPKAAGGPPIVCIGETLAATIEIRHTRQWNPSATQDEDAAEFAYDVQADASSWLLIGQKRSFFTAREGEVVSINVVLIPQRPGNLLLPFVEVKTAESVRRVQSISMDPDAGDSEVTRQSPEAAIRCETNCTTQSQSIVVIENTRSTTTGLGSRGHLQDGITLLESVARAG